MPALLLVGLLLPSARPAYANVVISGQAFNDDNRNGALDPGEAAVDGMTIRLDVGNDGVFDLTRTTDASGFYSFDIPGAPFGAYRVAQFPPNTRISTTVPQLVILPDGEAREGVNFGSYEVAVISGTAFDDLNGNGSLDGGEPGLDGVTITVDTDGGPPPEFTQVTSGGGLYTFQIDGSGAFFVRQNAPAGRTETTSEPQLVLLSAGDEESGVNFGSMISFTPISISGQAFDDVDGDGVKDGGDPGISGVTVELDVGADGSVDQTVSTDGSGNYAFAGLGAGTYRVRQVTPAGRTQTTGNPSDVVAASGVNVPNIDFGSFDLIAISGQAFDDLDGDGAKDGGEPGLPGVTVELDLGANGTVDQTTTTNGSGSYSFAGLAPGTYRVRQVVLSGRTQTTPDPSDLVVPPGVSGIDFGSRMASSLPSPPAVETPGTTKVEPEDKPDKLTQEQRQQRERTNASNLDEYRTEGNVSAVERTSDGKHLLVTIALIRDEKLVVQIPCMNDTGGSTCPDVRVGDYLEAEGWQGGKDEQGRFIAEVITIRRNGRRVP